MNPRGVPRFPRETDHPTEAGRWADMPISIPAADPGPQLQTFRQAFKPKYKFGYHWIGYNVLLGGNWTGLEQRVNALTWRGPARSSSSPPQHKSIRFKNLPRFKPDAGGVLRIDQREVTVHGRNAVCDGGLCQCSAGFLPIDPATVDPRAPKANFGRFAPSAAQSTCEPDNN